MYVSFTWVDIVWGNGHYLDQCWLLVNKVLRHVPLGNFKGNASIARSSAVMRDKWVLVLDKDYNCQLHVSVKKWQIRQMYFHDKSWNYNIPPTSQYKVALSSSIMKSWYRNVFHIIHPLWGESMVNSPNKGPVMWSYDVFCVVSLKKLLNKQLSCQWSEMPWHPDVITAILLTWSAYPACCMSALCVPCGPKNRRIKDVMPSEKRNSMSSWKSPHKLRQSRRYATSKSLLGTTLMACCLVSSGSRADKRSESETRIFLNSLKPI